MLASLSVTCCIAKASNEWLFALLRKALAIQPER
jgi:hypothetical protein